MIKNKVKKGFTLIEIIVAIAILGIVMVMVGNYFTSTLKINSHEQTINELQLDARRVLNTITQDIRTNSIISPANSGCIMSLKNGPGTIDYKYDIGTYTLFRTGIVISKNIKSITITPKDTNNNIYNINITTQKKNTSETYNIASSVGTKDKVAISTTIPIVPDLPIANYDDLAYFEKNMINVVDPNAMISFSNVAFNPSNVAVGILVQAKSIQFSSSGNNINTNIAIKADTVNWGNTAIGNREAVIDVKSFSGSPSLNSSNYATDSLISLNPWNVPDRNWHKISEYPAINTNDSYWKNILTTNNIKTMTVRTLKGNIDFKDKSVNPTLNIAKIHYFNSGSSNKITDNKLLDYKGDISSVAYDYVNRPYEYIICHGDLTIDTSYTNNNTNPTIRNFNFNGLIYCDGVLTIKNLNLDSHFSGITIAKGLVVTAVGDSRNWNDATYSNNTINNGSGLNEFNALINKITIP
ncbi:type II secretion system protein [Clostridium estertheticum]|uniref:type II secretion system protein n=1 Tax=Clostridium estertheticum TaxID=238834 RepID=UPI001C6DE970|nr:type II secretion system protein [Clostridium estertheticum]MBW9152005.1 type II secretion system GspH family protein [Clostridium estertheticum]WLC85039.1 type II secretion system GspH family protein [Clostridium estertheticum]